MIWRSTGILAAAALAAATALPAKAQAPTPEQLRQWLDLERRKVELAEQQQREKEADICAERSAPGDPPCSEAGTPPTTKPADPFSDRGSWVLIINGTAYIDGSAGEPTRFATLQGCQTKAANMLAYEAGQRGVGITQLDWPMQCLRVDAEKSVERSYGGPRPDWR